MSSLNVPTQGDVSQRNYLENYFDTDQDRFIEGVRGAWDQTNKILQTETSDQITVGEQLFGFDQSFAERVKNEWAQSKETKDSFQNDLNALEGRWGFSLFVEGAKNRDFTTLLKGTAYSVGLIALGSSFLYLGSQHPEPRRKSGLALLYGAGALAVGASIPLSFYNTCISIRNKRCSPCLHCKKESGKPSFPTGLSKTDKSLNLGIPKRSIIRSRE